MDQTNQISPTADDAARTPRLLLSGLDSLYVSFYLDTVGSLLDFDEFAQWQALRQDDRSLEHEFLRLGSEDFLLRPYGRYPYKFVLSNDKFEIALTERMQPNFYVKFPSKALWLSGINALERDLREWFGSLNLRQQREETVSRADWAFDYHIKLERLDADHFVSRARLDNTWRQDRDAQTIAFGTGDTVVRVYDKVAEIEQQSDKSWFYQFWGVKEDVWRIEAQIRRERLKLGGINTLSDLSDLGPDLLREVFSNHTTMRTPSSDSNRSRWPLSPLWCDLLRHIDEQAQTGLVAAYDPAKELDYRLTKSTQSIYGHLKHLAALYGIKSRKRSSVTLEELLAVLPRYAGPYHSPEEWTQEIERKINALEAGK